MRRLRRNVDFESRHKSCFSVASLEGFEPSTLRLEGGGLASVTHYQLTRRPPYSEIQTIEVVVASFTLQAFVHCDVTVSLCHTRL